MEVSESARCFFSVVIADEKIVSPLLEFFKLVASLANVVWCHGRGSANDFIHGRIWEAVHLEDKPLIRIFTEHQRNIVPITFSISPGFFLQVYIDIASGHQPLFLDQVIMHGCVPVIISNRLQPPFHQAQWWGKIFRVHPSQGCVKRENCWKLKKSS